MTAQAAGGYAGNTASAAMYNQPPPSQSGTSGTGLAGYAMAAAGPPLGSSGALGAPPGVTSGRNGDVGSGANSAAASVKAVYPITLKVMLSRDEASYLFGFDGVLLGQLRQQTGAHISLTDPQSFEHVLAIGGSIDVILKAFSLVCRKLWDFLMSIIGPNMSKPLIIRLAVPASQCGTIIGKQGAKVKELRELSGAYIQVSQESLPDSTERVVEISGTGESCVQCTYHICSLLQEAPVRGEVVPYIPSLQPGGGGSAVPDAFRAGSDAWRPVILCGPRAYFIDGDVARPCPPEMLRSALDNGRVNETYSGQSHPGSVDRDPIGRRPAYMNPDVLLQAITNAPHNQTQTSEEMAIPAPYLSAIIGPDGQKRAEIRQMSGAQIHVDDPGLLKSGGTDQTVTISGTKESITLAKFLIQSTIDMLTKEQPNQPLGNQAVPNLGHLDSNPAQVLPPGPPAFHGPPSQSTPMYGGDYAGGYAEDRSIQSQYPAKDVPRDLRDPRRPFIDRDYDGHNSSSSSGHHHHPSRGAHSYRNGGNGGAGGFRGGRRR